MKPQVTEEWIEFNAIQLLAVGGEVGANRIKKAKDFIRSLVEEIEEIEEMEEETAGEEKEHLK